MNVDGSNRQILDRAGWGAQWSADGRLAYEKGSNIVVLDMRTKAQRTILEGEHASRYSSIYWNLGWSRDNQRICFQGRRRQDNQFEITVAAVAGSSREFQVLYSSDSQVHPDFSWHPDGHRILLALPAVGGTRLFTLDRDHKPGNPALLPGQPANHSIAGADWSQDGRLVVFSSRVTSE
jgi:Tol biopolymer transport system component